MTVATSVAVLGLGTMGSAMARRLLGNGLEVHVWNRSPKRTEPFRSTAADIAESPWEAIDGVDVVLTMLFDAEAVREVTARTLPAAARGTIWMQSSTVGVRAAREFAAESESLGVRYVDAPMLGTKDPAKRGELTALLAGDADALARLRPVLDAVSTRSVLAGDAAPAASALKLAMNAWIATITAGIGQSLSIADHLGVAPSLVLEALSGTAPDSPYAQLKGGEVLRGSFDPQFEVVGLLKDIRLARSETPQLDDALLSALESLYARTAELGAGDEDIAAVAKAFAR